MKQCLRLVAMVCCCLPLILASCVHMAEKGADGSTRSYTSLGGKGAWRWGVGGIHNHEKSFRDTMFAVSAVAGTMSNTAITKTSEETARVSAQEATKRQAAQQVTQQTVIKSREAVTQTALQMEMPVPVTPP